MRKALLHTLYYVCGWRDKTWTRIHCRLGKQ